MAKIWFVRRQGERWIAPGGRPIYERPLEDLIFRLDLGPHRRLTDERPEPDATIPAVDPGALQKVIVETTPDDLKALEFTAFHVGFYDSPYSPREVVRRLAALPKASATSRG